MTAGMWLDLMTQRWVRATGRRVELAAHPWLVGPVGAPTGIADEWVAREASRVGGTVQEGVHAGLVPSMSALSGPDFDPSMLHSAIAEFYEQTSDWRMELWAQWSPLAWPFGWLLSMIFARRLEQLTLPLHARDVARGMDSRVITIQSETGDTAAWIRTLRSTGRTLYSGCYGTATLPRRDAPSIRVVFPLPNGSVTVFLRPQVTPDGNLQLCSPRGAFGDDGTYLIVHDDDQRHAWVRRVPIHEQFDVYLDDEGVLRADHDLRMGRLPAVWIHYRLDRRPSPPDPDGNA